MRLPLTVLSSSFLVACASAPAPRPIATRAAFSSFTSEAACVARAPAGDVGQLATHLGEGTRFSAPEPSPLGWAAGAYVRVQGDGSRNLSMGPEARAHACAQRPLHDDPSLCPVVSTDAFGEAVAASLQAIGIAAEGPVLGVGGELNWDPATPHGHEAWHMSVQIADWADADTALAVVGRALDAWGIGAPFGVSVVGTVCPGQAPPVPLEIIGELR